ncbi:MAG: ATP-binding protein [Acidobacteria bacterium]|nr:ATP-binding protein [Acidobacteriota bacterium]
METDNLKFSPEILKRLGEELIPHVDQGIVELVRNAYDADAVNCKVELVDTEKPGGTIRITDDGDGMDVDEIRNGWLLVGRSRKTFKKTTRLGRLPVGDKGLGRLAALRMGTAVSLLTRPNSDPNVEHSVVIDWGDYEIATTVEEVKLAIESRGRQSSRPSGTEITIRYLRSPLGKRDVSRLARSLLLLADPFEHKMGFRPVLLAPEFKELEHLVQDKYFDLAQYHLIGGLDSDGKARVKVRDWNRKTKWQAEHSDIRKSNSPYNAPPAKFECWIFLRQTAPNFSTRSATLKDLREWLDFHGGVHLYHRGLRVHPYGDTGHDWLEMNLLRTRNPELRPSTKTAIGRVSTTDPGEMLIQKTDRTGFVENEHFQELRSFAIDSLEWLATRRVEERERGRQEERSKATRGVKKARSAVQDALDRVPSKLRARLMAAIQKYERAYNRELKALRSEIQLYRTLATVGTTFAVFSHEVESPGLRIQKLAQSIEDRAKEQFGETEYKATIERAIESIIRSADEIRLFPRLALRLLERDRRRVEPVNVHLVVLEVTDLLKPFLDRSGITIRSELADTEPVVLGSRAAIESIVTNLLTNAFHAFYADRRHDRSREILVRTTISKENTLLLGVLDSGPGIVGISLSDIWLPGKTTFPDGSGLGLTIVRDVVLDLNGKARAIAKSDLGGAEIIIEIPLHQGKQ